MNITKTIQKQGFTQKQVAEFLGVNRVTLAQTINGNPTIKTLQKIADIIGCKVVDFFADELEPVKNENGIVCPHCGKPLHIELS